MKVARAIYMGGCIIESEDAVSYGMSKEKGLNCPFCSNAVFCVAGYTRIKNGKEEKISSHFSHYKNEQGEDCEARALTKEGREYIAKISGQARNQRLTLYNKRMWELLIYQKCIPKKIKTILNNYYGENQKELISYCVNQWKEDIPGRLKAIEDTIKALSDPSKFKHINIEFTEDIQALMERVKEELDCKIQYAIALEVMAYLGTKNGREVLVKLIELAMFDCIEIFNQLDRIQVNIIHRMAISSIALTQWEKAIEQVSGRTKGVGFK
jgi:hypothetical protein